MAVQFGTVVGGQQVSSAFTLSATDRSLLIGVSSHNVNQWYCAFQVFSGGPWLRFVDPWSAVTSQVFYGGGQGAGVILQCPPSLNLRIETGSSMTATTSFTILEVVR